MRALVKGFQLPISRLPRPQLKEGPAARGLWAQAPPKMLGLSWTGNPSSRKGGYSLRIPG